MVEIPTGSLVGLCLIVLVVGVILGRSSRVMSKVGRAHARAHGGDAAAKAAAQGGHADQRVQTVVVVDGDGVPRSPDGRYDLDALDAVEIRHHDRTEGHSIERGETVRGELVEATASDDDEELILARAAAINARRQLVQR